MMISIGSKREGFLATVTFKMQQTILRMPMPKEENA
jgi:hypothetical protein